ncbi:DUF3182 family protein [Cupriavidus sp. TMH.W2]|uniref:DUF3182 family protein n=1 Tax=Cupriavidus sp. TMH.W2 TaxID=3434465 RepID=UPI003D76ED4E
MTGSSKAIKRKPPPTAASVAPAPSSRRPVMAYGCETLSQADCHHGTTLANIARKVAEIAGLPFAGSYTMPDARQPVPYLVPAHTLVGRELADALGVQCEGDLFGGLVPHAFVATKAITHGLVAPGAAAPPGWSDAFVQRVVGATLPGFAAFALSDARIAALRLLALGPVRLKDTRGAGGLGQWVVDSEHALDEALAALTPERVESHGLVVERDLDAPQTYSVGKLALAGLQACYCGTQWLTAHNRGQQVYGGSRLTVVRGGFDALLVNWLREMVTAARAGPVTAEAAAAPAPPKPAPPEPDAGLETPQPEPASAPGAS